MTSPRGMTTGAFAFISARKGAGGVVVAPRPPALARAATSRACFKGARGGVELPPAPRDTRNERVRLRDAPRPSAPPLRAARVREEGDPGQVHPRVVPPPRGL